MDGLKKYLFWIVAIIIVSIPVILPLTKSGYFPTHDGEWAVIRLAEMHRELRDFQTPPRWSDFLNHGYGYPLFLFTYPFPYYLGEVLHLSGVGLTDSIKILFLASVIFSGIFMFLLGKEFEGEVAGFIAAALYMYAPFRLVDIYVRGSLGESLSFVLFPLLFWLSLKLITHPSWLKVIYTSITLAILILTHNIMAIIFVPIWLIFLLFAVKYYYEDITKYILHWFLPTVIIGLGLSAFFWLPALLEKKFILLSVIPLADISQHFVKPLEFLNSSWNYGVRPSFQLGWIHILLFLFGVATLVTEKGVERKKNLFLGLYILLSAIFLIVMMLSISYPVWQLPLLSSIDFPWRLITPLMFFLSLGAIFAVDYKIIKYFSILFIAVAFFLIPTFAQPQEYIQRNDDYYRSNDATTTSNDELMPLWVQEKPPNRYYFKVEGVKGIANIGNLFYNSRSIHFQIGSKGISTIKINTIYFPGWEFYIDKQKTLINYNNLNGLIQIDIPDGNHEITGKFEDTPVRKLADIFTLVSISLTALLLIIHFVPQLPAKLLWKKY